MKGTVLGIEKKEIYDKHIKRIVNAKVHLNIVLIKLPDINLITGIYNSKYKLDKMQAGIINIKLNKKFVSVKKLYESSLNFIEMITLVRTIIISKIIIIIFLKCRFKLNNLLKKFSNI